MVWYYSSIQGWSGYVLYLLVVIWWVTQSRILFSLPEKCGIFMKVQIHSLSSDNVIQRFQCLQEGVPPRTETEALHSLHKPCPVSSTIYVFYVEHYNIS